jgi:lipoprotein-releasing system permease protein
VYKLFLTLRYLREGQIAYSAVGAVTLCVALVLVQRAVMGGWLDQVKQRARGLLGDVILDNRLYAGFPLYDEFIEQIRTWPEIVQATPILYNYGLIQIESPFSEQTGTVSVVGIRLREVYGVNAFRDGLFYERYYPGTTTLDEQSKPLLGLDLSATPVPAGDGESLLFPPRLPEPYQAALERARREHQQRTGRPLEVPDAADGPDNRFLREHGMPVIPGEYAFNRETQEPALDGDPLPGMILGRDILAKRLPDGRYDRIFTRGTIVKLTYTPVSTRGQVDPMPKKRAFRYADDSRTGVFEIDSKHVYVDFDLLQRLLEMGPADRVDAEGNVTGRVPGRCSQIQIKVRPDLDRAALHSLTGRLQAAYHALAHAPGVDLDPSEQRLVQRVEALTWEQSQAHIIAPVEKEKMLVTILFGMLSVVAVLLILCILYMIVLQKTRDIGTVRAIGGSPGGVALIWVTYGACIGLVGGALGLVLGIAFVTNINEFQDFLITIHPSFRVWDLQVYSFDQIPHSVRAADAVAVSLAAVAAATLGSFAAAWRAGSMEPVEALRYE